MRILTNAELDDYLLTAINNALESGDRNAVNSFWLMYQTGIRTQEIELERWTIRADGFYILTPHKRNNQRVLAPIDLPITFRDSIDIGNLLAYTRSYSTLMRAFKQYRPNFALYVNQKEICSHLFRHNYMKKLKENGITDEQIQDITGEKKLVSAQNYIYSQIFTK